jgi:hypothetical protein
MKTLYLLGKLLVLAFALLALFLVVRRDVRTARVSVQ